MESSHAPDTGAPADQPAAARSPVFDSAELLDLARSIVGQPVLRDFTVDSTQQALRQASVPRISDASREPATEAVNTLAGRLRVRAEAAVAALAEGQFWKPLARELMEDAQMVAEEAAAG